MSSLRAEGLRVRRGSRVVLDVDRLDLEGGTVTVVLGAAGSGKSTLASALLGAIDAEGRVLLDGAEVGGAPSRRRRLGLAGSVRGEGILAGCTVVEALELAAGRRPAAEALDRFPQLARRRSLAAEALSGGEQQLLQVACAWLATPRALVLDSPTVGLASDAAGTVTALAREEAARGCAVLWLEPDPRAAPAGASLQLLRGRLAAAAVSPRGGG